MAKEKSARRMLSAENLQVATKVKAEQKLQNKKFGGSSNSLKTIMRVKAYWEQGWLIPEIAQQAGVSKDTVKRITAALNKVCLRSPTLKKTAITAAKEILEGDDNNNRVKLIDKIFYDEKQSQAGSAVSVNLNINQSELEIENPDFDYVDMDTY